MICRAFRLAMLSVVAVVLAASTGAATAQKRYDTGATDTEIKIGSIASPRSQIGRTEAAYFQMINDGGGINGRKINFTSYEDNDDPSWALELAHKLLKSDGALLLFSVTNPESASIIQEEMNTRKIPQLFVGGSEEKWSQPANFPWTMGWQPSHRTEGRIYARYLLQNRPKARVGVLFDNGEIAKELLQGFREGLGARAPSLIVGQEQYLRLRDWQQAGADTFVSFFALAREGYGSIGSSGWKPLIIQSSATYNPGALVDQPQIIGVRSAAYAKDPTEQWNDDAGMARFRAFAAKYMNGNSWSDVVDGYTRAQTLVQVLQQAGDDLTRENVMRQAASLKDFAPDMLLPGIRINTAADDFSPIEQMQIRRFDGRRWELGDVIDGEPDSRTTPPPAVMPPKTALAVAPPLAQLAPRKPAPVVAKPPAVAPADFGRRVALVIGNSAYRNAPALPNPTRDATDVAGALRRLGFQSVTLKTDLRREALVSALSDFAQVAQTADWAVVYFAGHGMEVGGVNYLLPVDAAIESDRDVPLAAVSLNQVLNATERAQKLRVVMLDACRSNPYAARMKRTDTVASRGAASRGFARVEPDPGTLVVYAAKDGETASDGDGRNSPFTTALIKNLQTPGIEVRRLFDNVRDDVQNLTKRQQMPYTYGSVSGQQDFYFLR